MSETYTVDKACSNCKINNRLIIVKGTKIEVYLKERKCFKCGCDLEC